MTRAMIRLPLLVLFRRRNPTLRTRFLLLRRTRSFMTSPRGRPPSGEAAPAPVRTGLGAGDGGEPGDEGLEPDRETRISRVHRQRAGAPLRQ